MSWHGPTPMIARDGQWVPSPFAQPPPTPAPPPLPAAPPTPAFSQPRSYSQTAPNYTSHTGQLVRNIEVGAAVWSAYELTRIRQAQQQSLAYQRESLRMQRAQTMLMAGWSLERVEAQFAWEDAQEAAEVEAAARRSRRNTRIIMGAICMPFGVCGWWMTLTGQFDSGDGTGTGSHDPGIILGAFMAVCAWLLLGMLWRVSQRLRSNRDRLARDKPSGEPNPPTPPTPSATPSGLAPRAPRPDSALRRQGAAGNGRSTPSGDEFKTEVWDRRMEELRERLRAKSRQGTGRIGEGTARKSIAARSSEPPGRSGPGQGEGGRGTTPEGKPS